MKCDESRRVTLYCSLSWFSCFIEFFRIDYAAMKQQQLEESKDEMIETTSSKD